MSATVHELHRQGGRRGGFPSGLFAIDLRTLTLELDSDRQLGSLVGGFWLHRREGYCLRHDPGDELGASSGSAAFLAHLTHESSGCRYMREIDDDSASPLSATFASLL